MAAMAMAKDGRMMCDVRVECETKQKKFDALSKRRDWEEDPLGFDTNPMLLRAMCMAFE